MATLSLCGEYDSLSCEFENTVFDDGGKTRQLTLGPVETVEDVDHARAIIVEEIVT